MSNSLAANGSLTAATQETSLLRGVGAMLVSAWRSLKIRHRERALRICDYVQLGDKRLLAIVECEDQRLLIGVTPQSITLLKALPNGRVQEASVDAGLR